MTNAKGQVMAVSLSASHSFSKRRQDHIRLLAGRGVEGDAHSGKTIKHRSRVAVDPAQPNLRQVHLMHTELFQELLGKSFQVAPGDLGENITTSGIDLLALPRGAMLHIGDEAIVEVTGLRNPCAQIDKFQKGLLAAVLDRRADGSVIRKSGVMGIIHAGGVVKPNDPIRVSLPPEPHVRLERV